MSLDYMFPEVRNGVLSLFTPARLSVVPCAGNKHLLRRRPWKKYSVLTIYLVTYFSDAYSIPNRNMMNDARLFVLISAERKHVCSEM